MGDLMKISAAVAQLAEHVLGEDEVIGSILIGSSIEFKNIETSSF